VLDQWFSTFLDTKGKVLPSITPTPHENIQMPNFLPHDLFYEV